MKKTSRKANRNTDRAATLSPAGVKRDRLRKSRRRLKALVIVLAAATLLSAFGLFAMWKWEDKIWTPEEAQTEGLRSIADSTEMMQCARGLKASVKELAAALKDQDIAAAKQARERMRGKIADTRGVLDSPFWKTAGVLPAVNEQLNHVEELLDILEEADRTILEPTLRLMEEIPFSELKTEEGLYIHNVVRYFDLFEQLYPEAGRLLDRVKALDLSVIDRDGKIAAYLAQADDLMAFGDEALSYLPAARAIIGDGGNRRFIFAAQNTSEMRASGGFPGAIATMTIENGYLHISEFSSVYYVFNWLTPYWANVTQTENRLFEGRLNYTWDADFCPNFERVAEIWTMGYEIWNEVEADGVVSATPAIIQKLLSFLGSITLSDGTVLDGENATRVLGHDLYFKYLGTYQEENAGEIVDDLFGECAKKTFRLLMDTFSLSHMRDYFNFFRDSIEDRSLMVWLKDEEGQQKIRDAGWNAGLNTDPSHPEIGVFFNSSSSSKMTWYLDIDPTLSEPTVNEDGSRTYEFTVRFSNVLTEEERRQASLYILGFTNGITGTAYVFAPAGGTIVSYDSNAAYGLFKDSYNDLELVYQQINVLPGQPYVLHCTITTAPGVDENVKVITPPTMQAYR